MKIGLALARTRPELFSEATVAAEAAGFESVWLSDHLVFPSNMAGGPKHFRGSSDDHGSDVIPGPPPTTPIYDPAAMLSFLAAQTQTIRLGTFVYLLGIRHPFVAARAVSTVDILSGGRVELGVGSGWLRSEWVAAGVDPSSRGARLEESIALCRRLWTEEAIEHQGEFWQFEEVAFEPKPVQAAIPILIGGESEVALDRAARIGDGWIGMNHSPSSAAAAVDRLRSAEARVGRSSIPCTVTIGGSISSAEEFREYKQAGVDRVILAPWTRVRDTLTAIEQFGEDFLQSGPN